MDRPQTLVSMVADWPDRDVIMTLLPLMEGQWPTNPMAPATLRRDTSPPERVLELHRLVPRDDSTAGFETCGESWSLPPAEDSLVFNAWWTPDQLDVAQNTALGSTKMIYEGRDHAAVTTRPEGPASAGLCLTPISHREIVALRRDAGGFLRPGLGGQTS